ncbi:TolC family protein [Roseiconus nitratireducens]|uniref:TolC family protein n=1 Tax=Roseiconus nitratireducens TaxID=2605748 RepID=A0A5M6CZF8_9BACT|nr:TolC family protein [Roseiconus nitratireducens]KAA5539402.1 TolC family protein [Roseiconus nitratireducens]
MKRVAFCLTILSPMLAVGCAHLAHRGQNPPAESADKVAANEVSAAPSAEPPTASPTKSLEPNDLSELVQTVALETELDDPIESPASPNDRGDANRLWSVDVEAAPFPSFEIADGSDLNSDLPSTEVPFDGTTYSLEELEQLALGNNPSIAAANATSRKAAGLRYQVGRKPNPILGYFGQQLADENTDQHGVFVEQEFVRGNKLELNRQVLAHTTNAQNWEIETQRYRVLTDIRVLFFEAIAAQQKLVATENFATIAERGVRVAEDRRNAEEGTLVESLQAKTQLAEVRLAAEQTEAAYRGAWKDLAAVAGLSVTGPVRLTGDPEVPSQAPDWQQAYAEITATSPELNVAEAIVCEKRAMLKRQQVQMIPNVTGQFGAGYDRSTDSGMINVQVGAPIPVHNQNRGNISAAYADYTRALENVERIELAIQSRLAVAARDFESALAAVNKYEQEIIPQATQALELSDQAYRAGELEFLQVLVLRRAYYESRIRLIEARKNLAQAAARVEGLVLTGGLEMPGDFTESDGIRGQSFGGQ